MAYTFYAQGKEIPRDRYGRPLVVPEDGGEARAYQRVTTLAKMLEDKTGLTKWELRQLAYGMSQRPDLVAQASGAGPEDKRTLDGIVRSALDYVSANQSGSGTAFHSFAENVDRGKPLGFVPDDMKPMLAAYEALMVKHDLKVDSAEEFVVLDEFEVGGTPDKVIFYEGQYAIGDIKTGSLSYPASWAIQLAVYARSKRYDLATARRLPLVADGSPVRTDIGYIIHVPIGEERASLVPIDLEKGWRAAQVAYNVALARQELRDVLGDVIGEERALSVEEMIEASSNLEELVAVWQRHQRAWTPYLTAKATERRLILEGQ